MRRTGGPSDRAARPRFLRRPAAGTLTAHEPLRAADPRLRHQAAGPRRPAAAAAAGRGVPVSSSRPFPPVTRPGRLLRAAAVLLEADARWLAGGGLGLLPTHPARPPRVDRGRDAPGHQALTGGTGSRTGRDGSILAAWSPYPIPVKGPRTGRCGEVTGVASIARDITGRKQAAARLTEEHSRFAGAFDAAIGMALVAPDGVCSPSRRALRSAAPTLRAMSFQELTLPSGRSVSPTRSCRSRARSTKPNGSSCASTR